MKIEIPASWDGVCPPEFKKTYTDSEGKQQTYDESPILKLEYGYLTVGSYRINISYDDTAKKLKRALEALYPS